MPSSSFLKSGFVSASLIAAAIAFCIAGSTNAAENATRSGAIGRRAAVAIQQRQQEDEIRQHMPVLAMQRRSETAIANNRHNLTLIDNFVGKALEILALAFGVAVVVAAAIEQKDGRTKLVRVAVGACFVLFGLFCPKIVHAICEFAARNIFA